MLGWLCSLTIIACLWCFNWKLFLATAVGIGLMSFCYVLQNFHWQRYWEKWQTFLAGSNRQLILAVGSGAIGSFCTYTAASIWADTENQWLATGAIMQGFASLSTLGILLWSLRQNKGSAIENEVDHLLSELSHQEPLKRLVAIRKLTRLLINKSLASDYYSQSIEYFQLMLAQPQLPTIKNALLESLELLDGTETTKFKRQAVRIPINLQRSRKSIEVWRK